MPAGGAGAGAGDPLHLVEGVGHRRLHPDAEDVGLEQPEDLDVVLVELAHREPLPAGLDRPAVEQGGVPEQHPAGVQRDVPGQCVEPFDEVEQQVEPLVRQPGPGQLGRLGDRAPRGRGPDVRERGGDGVDLGRRQAERRTGVADGVPHPVGVHHRDAADPLAAEPLDHPLVDLGATVGLDVDVDVGQLGPQRRAEPLHQQAVLERVDAADAHQVVDQAARPRAPGSDRDRPLAHQVAHLGDGEEVGRVPERRDGGELGVEPLGHGAPVGGRRTRVPASDPRLAARAQHGVSLGAGAGEPAGDEVGLGQVHPADPEVTGGVEAAPVGDLLGAAQQRAGTVGPEAGSGRDAVRERGHLGGAGEVPGRGRAVQVPGAQRHQPARGVEDVGGRGAVGGGVPDRGAEHRGQTHLAGGTEHPGRVRQAPRGVVRTLVADHLDRERTEREQVVPAGQHRPGDVGATSQERSAGLGRRPEQDRERPGLGQDVGQLGQPRRHRAEASARLAREPVAQRARKQVLAVGVPDHEQRRRDRRPALPAQVGGRDEPAQGRPPRGHGRAAGVAGSHQQVGTGSCGGGAVGEHGDARVPRVDHATTSRGRAAHRPACCVGRRVRPTVQPGQQPRGFDGEVDPEQRRDAGLDAGRDELDRSVEPVAVSERERPEPERCGTPHQRVRTGGSVPHRVAGGHVQVGEAHATLLPPRPGRAAGQDVSVRRRWDRRRWGRRCGQRGRALGGVRVGPVLVRPSALWRAGPPAGRRRGRRRSTRRAPGRRPAGC